MSTTDDRWRIKEFVDDRRGRRGDVARVGAPLRRPAAAAHVGQFPPLHARRRAPHPLDAGAHGARHRLLPRRLAPGARAESPVDTKPPSRPGALIEPLLGATEAFDATRFDALLDAAFALGNLTAIRDVILPALARDRPALGDDRDQRRPRALRQPPDRAPPAVASEGLGGRPRPARAARVPVGRAPHARPRVLRARARRSRLADRLPRRRHARRPDSRYERIGAADRGHAVRARPAPRDEQRHCDRSARRAPSDVARRRQRERRAGSATRGRGPRAGRPGRRRRAARGISAASRFR